ncbi:MAG: hypothetical protein JWR62_993 [Modestobacter sp.]|nr:hypothetical protein [Modestobacter sp.]
MTGRRKAVSIIGAVAALLVTLYGCTAYEDWRFEQRVADEKARNPYYDVDCHDLDQDAEALKCHLSRHDVRLADGRLIEVADAACASLDGSEGLDLNERMDESIYAVRRASGGSLSWDDSWYVVVAATDVRCFEHWGFAI